MPGFDDYVGFDEGGTGAVIIPVETGDVNIVRWIVASCRTWFDEHKGRYQLFYQNAGPKDLIDSHGKPIDLYAEFRVDGPYIRTITKRETWYDVDLNILAHAGIDTRNSDKIEKMIGWFASIFVQSIPVFKYGNGEDDDRDVQIGCLILQTSKGQEVRVSRFGQANPDTKLAQASIDAEYRMKMVL